MAYLRKRRWLELLALDHPGIGRLAARLKGRGAGAAPAQQWDALYRGGDYDRLRLSHQRHHHRMLAAFVGEAAPNPRVLEIGCGEGMFLESLKPFAPRAYLGVDISPLGIERARERWKHAPDVAFEIGDGSAFAPEGQFDAIVFAECLEYLGPLPQLLDHYRRFLAPGGVFGVSQWLGVAPLTLWREMQAISVIDQEALVMAPWGGAWQVWTCRPR